MPAHPRMPALRDPVKAKSRKFPDGEIIRSVAAWGPCFERYLRYTIVSCQGMWPGIAQGVCHDQRLDCGGRRGRAFGR